MNILEGVKRILKTGEDKKEFCVACGQSTIHNIEVDEQGEKWKVCSKCGEREYIGR